MSILGTRVLRVEDPLLLTTGATYTEDLVDERLTCALYATFVRSPMAHARVLSVDATEALASPGAVAVLTAADLGLAALDPFMAVINAHMRTPLLGVDVVRYVGEAVAVVLTEQASQGEDAADLVVVDYDVLPVAVDPRQAARDEVLLFPEAGTNTVCMFADGDLDEELFAGCEVVVTQEVVNQRVAPAPLEGRGAAAVWGEDGRVVVWLPNQGAQGAQEALAGMLREPVEKVRVITPDVGGAFGAKFGADPEVGVVAQAARLLSRPVRWSETRSENMVAMTHGRAQLNTVTIGGRRDGTVLAYRLEVLQDSGAYPRFGAILPMLTRLMAPGVYAFPKVESRTRRPSGGDGGGRAGDRPVRRGDRPGPGRGAAHEPAACLRRAAHHVGRGDLRQRRLRGGAGPRPRGVRLRRPPARAGRSTGARRRAPTRNRAGGLRRDHRRW